MKIIAKILCGSHDAINSEKLSLKNVLISFTFVFCIIDTHRKILPIVYCLFHISCIGPYNVAYIYLIQRVLVSAKSSDVAVVFMATITHHRCNCKRSDDQQSYFQFWPQSTAWHKHGWKRSRPAQESPHLEPIRTRCRRVVFFLLVLLTAFIFIVTGVFVVFRPLGSAAVRAATVDSECCSTSSWEHLVTSGYSSGITEIAVRRHWSVVPVHALYQDIPTVIDSSHSSHDTHRRPPVRLSVLWQTLSPEVRHEKAHLYTHR